MPMTKDHLNSLFAAWQDLPPEGILLPKLSLSATHVFCILSQLIQLMSRDAPDTAPALTPQHLVAMMPHVPEICLSGDSHFDTVKDSLQYLYDATKSHTRCDTWRDPDTQAPIFHHSAVAFRESVHSDLRRLWGYIGLSMTFLG